MKQHTIFYGSSYDRGLQHLLMMWGKIRKEIPDAKLHICYGWDLFTKVLSNNPERMAWKEKMDLLMGQEGITHHGRVSKDELSKIRQECGIWAYPTDFAEIHCITALDAQSDGLVPVVINYAALKETVQSGIKIDGDIYEDETKEKYLEELISIMKDEKRWEEESEKAKEWAKNHTWDLVAKEWTKHL